MRREWEPEELLGCWTLVGTDWVLIANKSGPTRLGFAVLLKFFEIDGRFPGGVSEVPPGHYLPGSNMSAWVDYSAVNAVRFFASLTTWCPDAAFDPGAGIETVDEFEARRAALRADPRGSGLIDWAALEDIWANTTYSDTNYYRLDYEVAELHRLGIETVIEAAELHWNVRGRGCGCSGRSTTR